MRSARRDWRSALRREWMGEGIVCRLMMKWAEACKYEQMYQDAVKESEEKEKETLVKESEERLKEYNQKQMMQLSMRSILG